MDELPLDILKIICSKLNNQDKLNIRITSVNLQKAVSFISIRIIKLNKQLEYIRNTEVY